MTKEQKEKRLKERLRAEYQTCLRMKDGRISTGRRTWRWRSKEKMYLPWCM